MSPAALALPAPLRRGLLLFRQHFGGRGGGGSAAGDRQEGARGSAPSLPGPAVARGQWALRAPLPVASTPAHSRPGRGTHAGMCSERPAVCLPRLSPRTSRNMGTRSHTRTHTDACLSSDPPPVTRPRVHPCTRISTLGVDGHPRAGGLGHTDVHTLKCSLTHTWHSHDSQADEARCKQSPRPGPPIPHPNSRARQRILEVEFEAPPGPSQESPGVSGRWGQRAALGRLGGGAGSLHPKKLLGLGARKASS